MTEKEIDIKNLQNMLRNSDMGADYYIDIIEQCLTLDDIEEKVIKPLLRTGAIPESLVVKQMFYLPIAHLANLNVSRSTIHNHFSNCITAVKKEKNIPRHVNIQDEGCDTYLVELNAKNERILRDIVSQLVHSGNVDVKVLGRYSKPNRVICDLNMGLCNDFGNMFSKFNRYVSQSHTYCYTLQLTGTPEDIDAVLGMLETIN